MLRSGGGTGGGTPTTIPPHTHHASEIIAEPEEATALLSGDDVQEDLEELGAEKLARSGEQPMLGALDMNHFSIDNADDADIEGTATVGEDVVLTEGVGGAIVTGPRAIHMAGDHADDEAKVDGLERVVFNDEPTASSIEGPSRLDMNIAVRAGVDYTPAAGRVSWDALEDTLVAWVASGPGVVLIAVGWRVLLAGNGA
jgi:hypothetical protein